MNQAVTAPSSYNSSRLDGWIVR